MKRRVYYPLWMIIIVLSNASVMAMNDPEPQMASTPRSIPPNTPRPLVSPRVQALRESPRVEYKEKSYDKDIVTDEAVRINAASKIKKNITIAPEEPLLLPTVISAFGKLALSRLNASGSGNASSLSNSPKTSDSSDGEKK
jgi:hypothetical protein